MRIPNLDMVVCVSIPEFPIEFFFFHQINEIPVCYNWQSLNAKFLQYTFAIYIDIKVPGKPSY